MNRNPSRVRALKRIAAATATVVGSVLLAVPSSATAQEDVGFDCTAFGGNPIATEVESALEIAAACDVEVRIEGIDSPYYEVHVTPDAQLHEQFNVGSAQSLKDAGTADATLIEAGGALVQTDSPWSFTLRHNGADLPLVATEAGGLSWSGTVPTPSYSGSTAVYDDLAAGLDLSLETGVSTLGMEFAVADAAAWGSLSTGMTLDIYSGTGGATANRLKLMQPPKPAHATEWEWITPYMVREADGTLHTANLAYAAGVVTLALPEETLASAVYPLTVSSQWAYYEYGANQWGSITSAQPDLSLLLGEAGLDEPYFTAAGQGADAVTGTYCDGLVDPDCATPATAATYWNFMRPLDEDHLPAASGIRFSYKERSATFRVDAAAGAECVAPALGESSIYRPHHTWTAPPPDAAPDITGTCQDGTAVYDLADLVGSLAYGAFVMDQHGSAARFDGDSARLEIFTDIIGINIQRGSNCSEILSSSSLPYGDFTTTLWRSDLIDYGLTWTATIRDGDDFTLLRQTEPAALTEGKITAKYLTGLPDGDYYIRYEFRSEKLGYVDGSECWLELDTQTPEILDVSIPAGPHYIGDKVTIEVSVSDAAFPDDTQYENDTLTVRCRQYLGCAPASHYVIWEDPVSFEVTYPRPESLFVIEVQDEVGHKRTESFQTLATVSRSDYDDDRFQDLFSVRRSDGSLMFSAGKGDGTFKAGVAVGTGWGKMDIAMAGDLTGDGLPDLLARDNRYGDLWTYPGNGSGGFKSRIFVGNGWNAMGMFTAGGDFNGDTKLDLLAVSEADDKLYLYEGLGNGKFGTRIVVGEEWGGWDSLASTGDFDKDGCDDMMAREVVIDRFSLFYGTCGMGFDSITPIDDSLVASTTGRATQLTGGNDYDGDGWPDVLAVDSATGELALSTITNLAADRVEDAVVVGTGWSGSRLAAAADWAYDYGLDGSPDLLARKTSTGNLHIYQGNGNGGFRANGVMETGWSGMNLVETAGDLNGDGFQDVVTRRASDGSLWLYPGNGLNVLADPVKIGTGWNAMSAIVSGHDFNGDGKVDIIAREKSTGYLWLYPGKGNGYVGTKVKIGTGWNSLREITSAGDLDHDGHADVLAIRSDNCMYFYGGRGNGTVKPGVKKSCNWIGYDQVASVGDFNGDGHADWVARRKSDGALFLYKGNAAGGHGSRSQIGTGWNSMNLIA